MEKILPEEIIMEILLWLPVKSLVIFKIVCKLWHSIISNRLFIEKHTQNQMITYYGNNYDIMRKDHMLKILIQTCTTTWGRLLRKYQACYHSPVIDNNHSNSVVIGGICRSYESGKHEASLFKEYCNNEFQTSSKFKNRQQVVDCPFFDSALNDVRMIGSCNGLICIHNHKDEIALWNPTIGDLKVVPPSQLQRPEIDFELDGGVGFGFDSCTNDYKVIQVLFTKSERSVLVPQQMEIYSLNTDSWRKYDHSTIPARFLGPSYAYYGRLGQTLVHQNEICCWSAERPKRKPSSSTSVYDVSNGVEEVILWFDMRDEMFGTTPFPQHSLKLPKELKMLPLHDSITLVFYNSANWLDLGEEKIIEIWSIKDLQQNESWTKLLNIGPLTKGFIRPLGFWNNGQFMILGKNNAELLLFNFRQRKVATRRRIDGYRGFTYSTSCVETLVAVNGYSSRL